MKRSAAIVLLVAAAAWGRDLYVSPAGDDRARGTRDRPMKTWQAAQEKARKGDTVWFSGGTYYLDKTVVLGPRDSGVTYAAMPGAEPIISGGVRLDLKWSAYRDGILVADVPAGFTTDQIFVNGERLHMARYPNYDAAVLPFGGWSADVLARAGRWRNPRGGYIHAMHRHLWGDFHYEITGKDASGGATYEGGWQNNRRMGMHEKFRFVENIFEELDAPGEWFLDRGAGKLYVFPPAGVELAKALVEGVRLKHLVEIRGSRNLRLRGLTFRHAARTFMDTREPLLRSDWTIYRGGAIFLTGAEDCALEEVRFDQVGGNAIFVSGYNRRIAIRRTHIAGSGASGVVFAGLPDAVRNPLFEYGERLSLADLDRTPGPKSDSYPADCIVEDSLIHQTGRVEKQTAPVQISMAQGITVRHSSIYDVPRAGINISEGTWGGHLIEFCDVFDTVKETGDHGSFNSWGRDRYWGLKDSPDRVDPGLPLLDAVKPTVIRNSRWRCDHGWDIDLDDGSSNYRIYNNLTLGGGIKLREGYHRTVENNLMANNSFHPHVWYPNSQDVFRRNIVYTPYKPIRAPKPWGAECDFNLLHVPGAAVEPARELAEQSGRDANSRRGDARISADFRLAADSPALALGFQPFPLDRFGVQWPKLKSIARTPDLHPSAVASTVRDGRTVTWLGATVRNLMGPGEVSAAGVAGETGVLVLAVPPQSRAAAAGLQEGDVILEFDGKPTPALNDLLRLTAAAPRSGIGVWRGQKRIVLAQKP